MTKHNCDAYGREIKIGDYIVSINERYKEKIYEVVGFDREGDPIGCRVNGLSNFKGPLWADRVRVITKYHNDIREMENEQ